MDADGIDSQIFSVQGITSSLFYLQASWLAISLYMNQRSQTFSFCPLPRVNDED
jgi:hypothetical protein